MSSSPSIIRVLMLSYGAATGKTSLACRLVNDTFSEEHHPTMGDIQSKMLIVDDEPVVIQILDTSGDPHLSQVAVESMKFADAFMVVYDASEANLSSCLPLRYSIVQEKQTMNPPMILVGNKSDLKRRTRKSSGRALAQTWNCPFIETSAKDNINVEAAFIELVRQHRARRRTVTHERKLTNFFSNAFPRLRTWDSSDQSARVIKSGWLHKRGFVRQNWKWRHFSIFDDGSVQYFADDEDATPLGEFNLKDVWQINDFCEDGHEDALVLQTKDRDWYLSFLGPNEKDEWLGLIVKLIAQFSAESAGGDAHDDLLEGMPPFESQPLLDEKRLSLSPAPSSSSETTATSSASSVMSDREWVEQQLRRQYLF